MNLTAGLGVGVRIRVRVRLLRMDTYHPQPCRFCIYATICVATNFAVLATFFLATFVLTERRMAANRVDCCCCITSTKPSGFATAVVAPDPEKGARIPASRSAVLSSGSLHPACTIGAILHS